MVGYYQPASVETDPPLLSVKGGADNKDKTTTNDSGLIAEYLKEQMDESRE